MSMLRKTLVWLLAIGLAANCWADIAVLREKGPKSGSLFSNIGLLGNPKLPGKITMKAANVKVHLRPGEGDQLMADCTADFTLEDWTHKAIDPYEIMVAFPVTGLSAKIVTIDHFAVLVDGTAPGKITQNTVLVSDKEAKTREDALLSGQLEARLYSSDENFWAGRKGIYPAYVWTQKSKPGSLTNVRVTYTATLRPQKIHYAKAYARSSDDSIPFDDMDVKNWDDSYYFFDYILVSGSTWDGPIGRETIEFSADPALGLSLEAIMSSYREPIGFQQNWSHSLREALFSYLNPTTVTDGSPRWIVTGKPQADYLFSIPVSALRRVKPVEKK